MQAREVKFPAYDEKLYGSKKEEFIHGFATGSTTKTVEKPDSKNPTKKVAVKTPNELGARKQTQSLNWTNTFIKFAMESTFGTALNVRCLQMPHLTNRPCFSAC